MKPFHSIGPIFSLLFIINLLTLSESCSVPFGPPPTLIDKINRADVLLYGKVLRHYPNQYFDRAYTAEMEVYCVLRGERAPAVVNVTEAGYIPGMCSATNLNIDEVYLVPVSTTPVVESLRSRGVAYKKPEHIQEALKACNLNPPTYPRGVDKSTAKVECPAGLEKGQCQEH